MLNIMLRAKRAFKELLGMPQWPKEQDGLSDNHFPRSFEEQIYIAVVRQNDICYDVGAHVGEVSLLLARLAGPQSYVVAFEPVWPTYVKLCSQVQNVSNYLAPIVTVPVGLAEANKVATIQVPSGNFGMGSLAKADDWSKVQPGSVITSYDCRFVTLSDFLKTSKLPIPDFIKIDVEGAELFILQGATTFFEDGHRPLMLIELFAPWERAFNYGPWELLSFLNAFGYCFLFACPNGLVEHRPSESCPFPAEYEQGYNVLVFCPEKHADRIQHIDGLRVGGDKLILPMPPPPVANTI